MRMEIKLQPQFNSSIYFHFAQKSKQAFYSVRVGIKKPAQKNLVSSVFFYFLRYLKDFISIVLIVMVLMNILPCNREKYMHHFTYPINNMLPIDKYDLHK